MTFVVIGVLGLMYFEELEDYTVKFQTSEFFFHCVVTLYNDYKCV